MTAITNLWTCDLNKTISGQKESIHMIYKQFAGLYQCCGACAHSQVSASLHIMPTLQNSQFISGLDKVDGLLLCKMILRNHSGWRPATVVWLRASIQFSCISHKRPLLMRRSSQNMRAAKCLKLSGCRVHLEITLGNFISRTNPVLVLEVSFYILASKNVPVFLPPW